MDKVGIGLYGSHIPVFRLDRKVIADNWGSCSPY